MVILGAATASAQDLSPCADIDEDESRLRCYDRISGREQRTPSREAAAKPEFRSRWERHLVTDAAREPFTIRAYQPNYALISHLKSFNYEPYRAFDPENQLSPTELKLNISLQAKLADDVFGNDGDIWIAYTQTSYWQVFNTDISSPFRATDYNPEVRATFLTDVELPGITLRNLAIGLRHDSNGQAGTLSRSWNRVFADFQFASGGFVVSIRPWVAVFDRGDNPDIEDYYGNFEVRTTWETRNQVFSATFRNLLDDHSGLELDWSFPISGRLRGLMQWYYGYGENLIDYNHKNNRIGIGVMMSDWL